MSTSPPRPAQAAEVAGEIEDAHSAAKVLISFDGEPGQFKNWVKSLEKYSEIRGKPQAHNKVLAYQTARGDVSDYIRRYLAAHRDSTWAEMKADLTSSFAEVVDPACARALLRTLKQKKGEIPRLFAQRLLTVAEDAYGRADRQPNGELLPGIEKQVVDFFIDGVFGEDLRRKLMKEDPKTIQEAVEVAGKEQQFRKRYEMRSGHGYRSDRHYSDSGHRARPERRDEPMEIDQGRAIGRCHKCGRYGHRARFCRVVRAVDAAQSPPKQNDVIKCWTCGEAGHMRRECTKRYERMQCYGCGRYGHPRARCPENRQRKN